MLRLTACIRYDLGPTAMRDELFVFRRSITMEKELLPQVQSTTMESITMQKEVLPQAARNVSSPMLENEDSMEAPPRWEIVSLHILSNQ